MFHVLCKQKLQRWKTEQKMIIIENTAEFHIDGPSAIALGKFDGIHRGHRLLLDKIIEKKKMGYKAVVFTFDISPLSFFSKKVIPGLTTREEKRRIFELLGIDVLVELPLNEKTAATSPEKVITQFLVSGLGMKYIVAGEDLSFGDKGKGNVELLQRLSKEYDYDMDIVQKLYIDEYEVSSTVIREQVTKGNMPLVEKLIGVPYCIIGEVVHGKKLGRTIGMPTVNQLPDMNKLLPPNGVYYSTVSVEGRHYKSITNIGCKPTVSNSNQMGVETYLYDFDGDLYGKDVRVKLLEFKRPEMRFKGIDELKAQMEADLAAGAEY